MDREAVVPSPHVAHKVSSPRWAAYPALQRMLKAGWLETEMGLSARNRPVRIFKVTEAGRKHLEQELASVEKMFAGVTRVLALAGQ
jgi:PadR family transcriptional regulator PadR